MRLISTKYKLRLSLVETQLCRTVESFHCTVIISSVKLVFTSLWWYEDSNQCSLYSLQCRVACFLYSICVEILIWFISLCLVIIKWNFVVNFCLLDFFFVNSPKWFGLNQRGSIWTCCTPFEIQNWRGSYQNC